MLLSETILSEISVHFSWLMNAEILFQFLHLFLDLHPAFSSIFSESLSRKFYHCIVK